GFDVPEAVGALVAFVADAARVEELALDLGDRQGHKARILASRPPLEFFGEVRSRPGSGHHDLAGDPVRCVRRAARHRAARVPPDLSAAGLGRARPARDLRYAARSG